MESYSVIAPHYVLTHGSRFSHRAIVENEHLEIRISLCQRRIDGFPEKTRPIQGRDEDANEGAHTFQSNETSLS